MSLGVGLYGANGHQIWGQVRRHPQVRFVAAAGVPPERLTEAERQPGGVRLYATLDELLADPAVELVSLCSPRRADQVADAIRALEAGKHVYAEKPCALHEPELDAILATAARTGRRFHEMAGTVLHQPFVAVGEVVRSGRLGPLIQVVAQKSYPYGDFRPQDEAVDGGLTRQAGVHAFRFVAHLTGLRILSAETIETSVGNPRRAGGLRMASATLLRLAGGAIATVTCNYLNQPGLGAWGNDAVRIWGFHGMVEAVDGGQRTRLILGQRDCGPLDTSTPSRDYFDCFVDELLHGTPMPFSLDEELHPLRLVLRAKEYAS
jgi:predicted dehydrogenase